MPPSGLPVVVDHALLRNRRDPAVLGSVRSDTQFLSHAGGGVLYLVKTGRLWPNRNYTARVSCGKVPPTPRGRRADQGLSLLSQPAAADRSKQSLTDGF